MKPKNGVGATPCGCPFPVYPLSGRPQGAAPTPSFNQPNIQGSGTGVQVCIPLGKGNFDALFLEDLVDAVPDQVLHLDPVGQGNIDAKGKVKGVGAETRKKDTGRRGFFDHFAVIGNLQEEAPRLSWRPSRNRCPR